MSASTRSICGGGVYRLFSPSAHTRRPAVHHQPAKQQHNPRLLRREMQSRHAVDTPRARPRPLSRVSSAEACLPTARCKDVRACSSRALMSGFVCSNSVMAAASPVRAAACKGVWRPRRRSLRRAAFVGGLLLEGALLGRHRCCAAGCQMPLGVSAARCRLDRSRRCVDVKMTVSVAGGQAGAAPRRG